MKSMVSAQGYTSVVVVLDIGQLVESDQQAVFESIRATPEFAHLIKTDWHKKLSASPNFIAPNQESAPEQGGDCASVEEIGFATGVFRAAFLEEQLFPTYQLNKQSIHYPEKL